MMQGDQYRLPIFIKYKDGSHIPAEHLSEIELTIGGIIKTMSEGAITYDAEKQLYYALITQKETFLLRGKVNAQLRIKFIDSDDVVGLNLGQIDIAVSLSKVVL